MRAASRVPISYLLPHWLRSPMLPLVTGNELRAILPAWAVAEGGPAFALGVSSLGGAWLLLLRFFGCLGRLD